MESINIFFTRSFSNNYHFINSVRKYFKDKKIRTQIIVSHPDKYSPTLLAADIRFIEPSYIAEENESFYKFVCAKYNIDCIIPGESSILTLTKSDSFVHQTKVKVLVSQNFDTIKILRSKTETYKFINTNKINKLKIPWYKLVNNISTFQASYDELIENKGIACFKPDISQGGAGFRIIDNNINAKDIIYGFVSVRNTFKYYLEKLQEIKTFPPIILLQYLSGHEYSIDCLGNGNKLIFCGIREKSDKKRRIIKNDVIFEIAKDIQRKLKFSFLYNIQLRAENGEYYLLEINPRYSAGSYIYELDGFNLLGKAIEMLLFKKAIEPMNMDSTLIQSIENYIKI